MSKILIISATKGTNFILAKNIKRDINIKNEIVVLEDYEMPLYLPNLNNIDKALIYELGQKFKNADGLIFCAPEYNGGSPPILTNAITWISVITDNFRELFSNKKALIGTHSGGAGARFLSTFRIQLEHLGVIVFPRTIMVNNTSPYNEDSVKSILNDFIKLI